MYNSMLLASSFFILKKIESYKKISFSLSLSLVRIIYHVFKGQ